VLSGDANGYVQELCAHVSQLQLNKDHKTFNNSAKANARPLLLPTQSNSDLADQINALLGTEHSLLVFDARKTFDEKLFAAACGSVSAGGLLILQTPKFANWDQPDPNLPTSLFIRRITNSIKQFCVDEFSQKDTAGKTHLIYLSKQQEAAFEAAIPSSIDVAKPWKTEQDKLVASLAEWLLSPTGSVAIIQADRGRGKSTLVGRALQQQAGSNPRRRIAVTANRRSASDVLWQHAKTDQVKEIDLTFMAIDAALQNTHDILVVEEAGSVPISILLQLQQRCKKILFATTVQGYEGAGRGFALRFDKAIRKIAPDRIRLLPTQPIRWASGDPLEAFVNQALLLGNNEPPADVIKSDAINSATVSYVNREQLANDEALLTSVYSLLKQAHYQTTPADLRHLLDSPGLRLFVQQAGDHPATDDGKSIR